MGGWISWKYSQLSPAKAEARAELGNIDANDEESDDEEEFFRYLGISEVYDAELKCCLVSAEMF